LQQLRIDPQGKLMHPARLALEAGTQLLASMSGAAAVDESTLCRYLRQQMDEAAIRLVLLPLLRAYIRDPELLRRYNYGRGHEGQPVLQEDSLRVQKARYWLRELAQKGFPSSRVQELARDVPFVGPYAAFMSYIEMLLAME